MGATRFDGTPGDDLPVSIHAPVMGATIGIERFIRFIKTVSIHAPVMGATISD